MTERAAGSVIVDAAAAAAREAAPAPAEQLGMFGDLPPGLDPENTWHASAIEGVKRERGRPAGASNRMTRDVKALVNRLLGDPLLEQANWARHTPQSLARVLGCTKIEAFDRLMQIYRELAPYLHARLAPVDGQGNAAVPVLQIVQANGAPLAGAGRAPWEYMQEVQQNQPLPPSAPAVSHGAGSHEEGK